jgi:hypothetical protein
MSKSTKLTIFGAVVYVTATVVAIRKIEERKVRAIKLTHRKLEDTIHHNSFKNGWDAGFSYGRRAEALERIEKAKEKTQG